MEKQILLYAGFYPNKGFMTPNLYYLLRFLHCSVIALTMISLVAVIALYIYKLSTIIDALVYFITMTCLACKIVNILINGSKFTEIEELLKKSRPAVSSSENIVEYHINFSLRFARWFRIACFLTCMTNGTLPLMGEKLGHAMLLGWSPWKRSETIKYYLNAGFQCLALCISAHINSTIDILTVKLIAIATSQVEILKNNLVNIRYNEVEATKQFKENVNLHLDILRFVYLIGQSLSVGMLAQIFGSVLVICVTAFQLVIVSAQSVQGFFLLLYLLCMVCQIAMYCWFGHYLMDSSQNINQCICMSNWYEADHSLKRCILIFMERCKRPMVLKIGELFPLSLLTFTSILQSSYSYYAVLRTCYELESA